MSAKCNDSGVNILDSNTKLLALATYLGNLMVTTFARPQCNFCKIINIVFDQRRFNTLVTF